MPYHHLHFVRKNKPSRNAFQGNNVTDSGYLEKTLAPGDFRGELADRLSTGAYKFHDRWDAPSNRNVFGRIFHLYTCNRDPAAIESELTSFVVVVGPSTAWPGATPWRTEAVCGVPLEAQILLVEVANSGIKWMEPRDLSLEEALGGINPESGLGISSRHVLSGNFFYHDAPLGAMALFADGSVRTLPPNLPRETLEALLIVTADPDRKLAALEELEQCKPERRIHWPNCTGLAVLLISVGIMIFRRRDKAAGSPIQTPPPEES